MKASLIQLEIKENESSEELINRVFGLIDSCRGSDIIVLPELWHIGILSYRTIWNFAEERDGPLMRRISAKARELGAFIHCGSFVHKEGDRIFNTSILFDRKGTDIAEYRKIHLFSCYGREADSFTHGTKAVVVDTEFGRLGLAICYDIRFPELFRMMTLGMGAEIFIVPAAWPYPRAEAFRCLNKVRAMENSAYLLSCNLAGPYKHLTMVGESGIIDPWGEMLTEAAEGEGIVHGEASAETVRQMRREFPVFDDVRLVDSIL
ncbi:MAG: nitrilase-related carbon-nitrogen hydrolase [Synergistaceae bacterium]|nr:nitrilase-related carbon-nitrogen hydrolase [Synergistaceae bacterium]